MNYYALIGLFNGIVVLLSSVALFLRKPRIGSYKSFLSFSLSIGLWSIFYAFWQMQNGHDSALFWMRVAMLMCYPSCFGFLWFVMEVCGLKFSRLAKIGLIATPLVFMVFAFSSLMIRGVAPRLMFPYWPIPGSLMFLYTFVFCFCVAVSFLLLIITYLRSVGAHRAQLQWIIFSMLPAWFGGMTNWLLWYGIDFPPLPNFFVGVGWLLLAYAMIRTRFFDVDVLADYVQEARLSAIGLLTASIHHEIKSPVFVMKGSAEACLEKIQTSGFATKEEAESAVADLSHKILNQSQRVLEIIRSFRDMANRKTGRVFEPQPVFVRKVLENIMPLIKSELDSKQVSLIIDIEEDLKIYVDPYSAEEIFLNLILNACQALKNTLQPTIKLSANIIEGKRSKTGDQGFSRQFSVGSPSKIVITISDNGPGVSAQDLNRLFEPFYTTKKEGTGLGLYVVKQLIERNHAEIRVFAKVGEGTSFSIYL